MKENETLSLEKFINERVHFGKSQILYHIVFYGMTIVAGFYSCSFGIILPVIQQERHLSNTQVSIINSGQFFAQFISSILFLFYLEVYLGRKNALLVINIGVTIGLLMIYLADQFITILTFILVYNFFIGSSSTYNSLFITELNTSQLRTLMQIILYISWPIGMMITTLFCMLVFKANLYGDQWRTLFLIAFYISLVPLFITIFVLVESPRYSLYKQDFEKAFANLNFMGKLNNSSYLPLTEQEKILLIKWRDETFGVEDELTLKRIQSQPGVLNKLESPLLNIPLLKRHDSESDTIQYQFQNFLQKRDEKQPHIQSHSKKNKGFSAIFTQRYVERTVQLAFIRFFQKLLYYGQTIMIPTILYLKSQEQQSSSTGNIKINKNEMSHYFTLLCTISVEFPANYFAQKLLKKHKRTHIISATFLISGFFNILSSLLSDTLLSFSLAATNFFAVILQTSVHIYVNEAYQIQVRAIASGFLNICSSLGAIAMPWIFQFSTALFGNSGALYAYAILNIAGGVIALFLKKELLRASAIDRATIMNTSKESKELRLSLLQIYEKQIQESEISVEARALNRRLSSLGGTMSQDTILQYAIDDPLQEKLKDKIEIELNEIKQIEEIEEVQEQDQTEEEERQKNIKEKKSKQQN